MSKFLMNSDDHFKESSTETYELLMKTYVPVFKDDVNDEAKQEVFSFPSIHISGDFHGN